MTAFKELSNLPSCVTSCIVVLLQISSILAQTDRSSAAASLAVAKASTTTPAPLIESRTSTVPTTTHTVEVGNNNFQYDPDSIEAGVGDMIEFRFFAPNHSVARAEYKMPCVPIESTAPGKVGFWSGFRPVVLNSEDPPIFQLRVNDTNPVFFYCSAPGSCIKYQMVGVINPNSSMTLDEQKYAAKSSKVMYAPGESIPNEDGSSTTPATSSSATPIPASTKKLSNGAIAGIAVAGATVLILLTAFVFLLGRHTSMMRAFKPSELPASANPKSPDPSARFPSGFQSTYSGAFASPRPEMGKYAPPYDAPFGAPYQAHPPSGHMPELGSTDDYPTSKGLAIQRDQVWVHEHSRQQTISPPLGSPRPSELDGEPPRLQA